jgi:hypothetical protein
VLGLLKAKPIAIGRTRRFEEGPRRGRTYLQKLSIHPRRNDAKGSERFKNNVRPGGAFNISSVDISKKESSDPIMTPYSGGCAILKGVVS